MQREGPSLKWGFTLEGERFGKEKEMIEFTVGSERELKV